MLGGLLIAPHQSLAQYPGSAGGFSSSGFGVSTSSSSNSSDSTGSGSESYNRSSQNNVTDSSSIYGGLDTDKGATSYADGRDDSAEQISHLISPVKLGKGERKRVLIKKFRDEFAKTAIVETTHQQRFEPQTADIYLEQFAHELAEGLDQLADRKSLAQDLALVREAIDTRLDCLITAYASEKITPSVLPDRRSQSGEDPSILDQEIKQLSLKHDLMQFSELSLQALGTHIK